MRTQTFCYKVSVILLCRIIDNNIRMENAINLELFEQHHKAKSANNFRNSHKSTIHHTKRLFPLVIHVQIDAPTHTMSLF